MLDLQKYLKKAAADPEFRARLLKNPNQAIKDEFGEDLPYQLKCKEKLVFEVEPMEEMSDADAIGVAGGNPPKGRLIQSIRAFNPTNIRGTFFLSNTSNNGTYTTKDENGRFIKTDITKLGDRTVEIPPKPRLGAIPESDLNGVAGGAPSLMPVEEWEDETEGRGFTLSTLCMDTKTGQGFYKYYNHDDNGVKVTHGVKLVNVDGTWYADTGTER